LPTVAYAQEPAAAEPAAPAEAPSEHHVQFTPVGRFVQGAVTHYGVGFNGQPLGCGGVYSSDDPTIIAIGPAHYAEWPCGTAIVVCGPNGCLVGVRQDSCPGCTAGVLDLSEAGIAIVCGPYAGRCNTIAHAVTIEVVPLEEAAGQGDHGAQPH
jgi:hypothetical protein